jgi:hypothetical protein
MNDKEQSRNSLDSIPYYPVYAYNLSEGERPGGMKVRWKVRVVSGPEAGRHEVRLNAAIWEALRWIHTHPPR